MEECTWDLMSSVSITYITLSDVVFCYPLLYRLDVCLTLTLLLLQSMRYMC